MLKRTRSSEQGSVAVEFALVGTLVVFSLLVLIELMSAFFQWNTAQRAVRAGARLASVSAPVAQDIITLELADEGDYVPAYSRICYGSTRSCTAGTYDRDAMDRIIFGADDECASEADKNKRGMCDILPLIEEKYVVVEYNSTLNEVYGAAGGLQPLVTVRLKDVPLSYGIISGEDWPFAQLPDTFATVIAQDLSNGG